MITRQGLRVYRDALDARTDPRGKPYYWIGGEFPIGVHEEGTDYGAIKAGYVSITPLQLDLTAREAMETMKKWKWDVTGMKKDCPCNSHPHLTRSSSTTRSGISSARSHPERWPPTGRSPG